MKKTLVNLFLITWLTVFLIDAAPLVGPWHKSLKRSLDPYVDALGLWQNGWGLFAPDPDKINVSIQAEFFFADDSTTVWNSPDWRSMSIVERFLRFREAEFIDNVRMNKNYNAWTSFARYLANKNFHPDKPGTKPTLVVLSKKWFVIPKPTDESIRQFPELPEKNQSFIIFANDVEP